VLHGEQPAGLSRGAGHSLAPASGPGDISVHSLGFFLPVCGNRPPCLGAESVPGFQQTCSAENALRRWRGERGNEPFCHAPAARCHTSPGAGACASDSP
jgi:hypothetical protein